MTAAGPVRLTETLEREGIGRNNDLNVLAVHSAIVGLGANSSRSSSDSSVGGVVYKSNQISTAAAISIGELKSLNSIVSIAVIYFITIGNGAVLVGDFLIGSGKR